MSSLLDDVLGSYLDLLTEREFDAPFLALLRARGYRDIHFLHGTFEFGKDFIAKLDEAGTTYQAAFQTKGGNLGISEWRVARGQIDEMRTNNLAHPNYDSSLPRQTVFVTTGRLTGGAPVSAQEYGRHLEQLGEGGFEVWDRETIVTDLVRHPSIGLAGTLDVDLMRVIADISAGAVTQEQLEQWSRPWVSADGVDLLRGALAAAVVAARCREVNRIDLAAHSALLIVRAAVARLVDGATADASLVADLGGNLFERYAGELSDRCRDLVADPEQFAGVGELAIWITYPVRVARTAEILALYVLRLRLDGRGAAAEPIGAMLRELISSQPGAAHPVSDKGAATLIPIGLALGADDEELFGTWVTEIVRWTANRYDRGPGLASLGATSKEEVEYLAGSALEHVNVPARTTSLVATAVLDLVSVFERADLYDLAVNELLAVDVLPDVVEVGDVVDQCLRDGVSVTRQVNWAHDESWHPTDHWKTAAHHRRSPDPYAVAARYTWEHVTLVSVLRDRMFATTQRLVARNLRADSSTPRGTRSP